MLIPNAKNKIAIKSQARYSFERRLPSCSILCLNFQQLIEVAKYNATVSQPTNVGSPIPGVQLNEATSCVLSIVSSVNIDEPPRSSLTSFESDEDQLARRCEEVRRLTIVCLRVEPSFYLVKAAKIDQAFVVL